jgi:hypothetical protein
MDVKIRKLAVDGYRKGDCIVFSLFNHTLLLCFFIKGGECLHTGCTGSDGLVDSHVLEPCAACDLNSQMKPGSIVSR